MKGKSKGKSSRSPFKMTENYNRTMPKQIQNLVARASQTPNKRNYQMTSKKTRRSASPIQDVFNHIDRPQPIDRQNQM